MATDLSISTYDSSTDSYEHIKRYLPMTLAALMLLCLCLIGRGQDSIPSGTILFHYCTRLGTGLAGGGQQDP